MLAPPRLGKAVSSVATNDPSPTQAAAATVGAITGDKLDVLIANAAIVDVDVDPIDKPCVLSLPRHPLHLPAPLRHSMPDFPNTS